MQVFVVMGNDYPDAVFTTSDAAEQHCIEQRRMDEERGKSNGIRIRIFWRVYEFPLQGGEAPLQA